MSTRRPTRAARRRQTRTPGPAPAVEPAAKPAPAPAKGAVADDTAETLAVTGRLLFFAWVATLGFRPVTNNDFWFHLRVGKDILASGAIPRVDVYSIVPNQPMVEQGWLASVVLALIDRYLGPWGFTALVDLAGVVTVVLLYFAVPRRLRDGPWTLPLLAFSFYLSAFGIAARPLVFTMPIIATFVLCLARWRRTRRARDIVPLIAVEVFWANVHGSFLFGPVLLWGVVGCCALLALAPRLQAVPDEPPYGWRDVRLLALVALGCSLAIVVTPYGAGSARLALQTWSGNDVVRQSMSEWQGPFDAVSYFRQNFEYLFRAYCVLLALLGVALLVRVGERPLLDAALVGVTVYLSVKGNRFIPYAAAFGYPVLVRAAAAVTPLRRSLFAVSAMEIALGVVLLAVTLTIGYPFGAKTSGTLGSGIADKWPRAEVALIRERGWSGVLYNELLTDGSYVLHELHPRVRPVIDAHLGGDETLYVEYEATRARPDLLANYLEKYDVRLALLVPGSWIPGRLGADARWRLVERSAQRLLYVRD